MKRKNRPLIKTGVIVEPREVLNLSDFEVLMSEVLDNFDPEMFRDHKKDQRSEYSKLRYIAMDYLRNEIGQTMFAVGDMFLMKHTQVSRAHRNVRLALKNRNHDPLLHDLYNEIMKHVIFPGTKSVKLERCINTLAELSKAETDPVVIEAYLALQEVYSNLSHNKTHNHARRNRHHQSAA